MTQQASKTSSAREMMETLKSARDRTRVQAHLFTLEARQRWQELDAGLTSLQTRLEQGSESVAAAANERFRELTEAVRQLLHEFDGTLELRAPVRNHMKPSPSACSAGDSLNQAAQIMWELDCGALPVVDGGGGVIGMITDRDICMAGYTRGQPLGAMRVESAMSHVVHACSPEDTLGHAARLMAERQVRRLPVIENGKLVGVLTLADIARVVCARHGNRVPACVALAHTVAAISAERTTAQRASAAE